MSAATLTPEESNRYSRHLILPEIGLAGQQKLKAAKVLVIGAGGLGCPVLQYLAAAGVGTLGIVDFDRVEESNLQRQILFSTSDVGSLKADAAKERLLAQNPYISIISHPFQLQSQNALEIMREYDLVIDGSDNFTTRYLINDACVMLHKPLVFGSIFKFEGQVSVFNYRGGPTYRCLYPEASDLASCSEVGVLGVLPGLVGCLMANEAIKVITGIGEVATGKLLLLHALTLQFNTFVFGLNPDNLNIQELPQNTLLCDVPIQEIAFTELLSRLNRGETFTVLDVREEDEYQRQNIGGQLFPLSSLEEKWHLIDASLPLLVHCQSGLRSKKAYHILQKNGFTNLYNLSGGLNALTPEQFEKVRGLNLR
ncbi:molybdopterin-synthase adenylyltransferase MoeB [Rufibacter immobilis]|uniref:molybdopterin-synthase adenylyltransferase MoeB n=1 Tax=Rufibacter immobilis TaxID=1348778 RepID=UPI0035EC3F51